MRLDDFAGELVASNKFVKAGLGGMAGSGKSKTGTDFVIGAYKDLGYTKPMIRKVRTMFFRDGQAKFLDWLAMNGIKKVKLYATPDKRKNYFCFSLRQR